MRKFIFCISTITALSLLFYIVRENRTIDTISVHIGKPYEEVSRDSTFPIKKKTVIYPSESPEPDSIWMRNPVIVKFDDPRHGFTLPPTKFGVIGFNDWKVTNITTSPMLETLPFDQLVPLLNHVQKMLKASGWVPQDNHFTWINLDSEIEKNALQNLLFKQVVVMTLRVPHKYGLSLNIKCYTRCNERDPKTAKYLIDVSVGKDFSNQ